MAPVLSEVRKGIQVTEPDKIVEIEYGTKLYGDEYLFRNEWGALGGHEKPVPFKAVKHLTKQ